MWTRIKDSMTDEEVDEAMFNNSLIANKRPAFMQFLYQHYGRKFRKEEKTFDLVSLSQYGKRFSELLSQETNTKKEIRYIDYAKRKSDFIRDIGTMNRVSNYLLSEIKKAKTSSREETKDFEYKVLLSKDYEPVTGDEVHKMVSLYKKYKKLKNAVSRATSEHKQNLDNLASTIRDEAIALISTYPSRLADIAVVVSYGVIGQYGRSFVWNVFGDYLLENLLEKSEKTTFDVPVKSPIGKYVYLYNKYEIKKVSIHE